jgi:hypothetical protein
MNYLTISPARCVSCWSLQGRPHGRACQFAHFTVRTGK